MIQYGMVYEVMKILMVLLIELLHLQKLLLQPFRCSAPDFTSILYIMAMHIYLQEMGTLNLLKNWKTIEKKVIFGVVAFHTFLVNLSLALVWDPFGCILGYVLDFPKSLGLIKYLYMCRLGMALALLMASMSFNNDRKKLTEQDQEENQDNDTFSLVRLWDAFQFELVLDGLGLHYREPRPPPRPLPKMNPPQTICNILSD